MSIRRTHGECCHWTGPLEGVVTGQDSLGGCHRTGPFRVSWKVLSADRTLSRILEVVVTRQDPFLYHEGCCHPAGPFHVSWRVLSPDRTLSRIREGVVQRTGPFHVSWRVLSSDRTLSRIDILYVVAENTFLGRY